MIKKIKEIKDFIENNKVICFILGFLKAIAFIIIIMLLMVIILQKFPEEEGVSFGGLKIYNVITGSMMPEYNVGDIIFVMKVSPEKINVGDDITFIGNSYNYDNLVITHRVVEKTLGEDGEYRFVTKGLSNQIDDPEIKSSQIYGKVIYKSILLSLTSKLLNNTIAYFIIISFLGISISWQIIKNIVGNEDEDEEIDGEGEEAKD